MPPKLPITQGGVAAQIFTLQPGNTAVTTGTVPGVVALHCVSYGDLVITYPTGDEETITFSDGDQFGFEQPVSVSVSSGEFHFMGM